MFKWKTSNTNFFAEMQNLFSFMGEEKVLSLNKHHYQAKLCTGLDRRTILCLYVPGFHRRLFKYVPKGKWIPLTKLPWIPRKNICNVIFVGPLYVDSEFLLIAELAYEQLTAEAGILIYSNAEFKSMDLKLTAESKNKSQNIG